MISLILRGKMEAAAGTNESNPVLIREQLVQVQMGKQVDIQKQAMSAFRVQAKLQPVTVRCLLFVSPWHINKYQVIGWFGAIVVKMLSSYHCIESRKGNDTK